MLTERTTLSKEELEQLRWLPGRLTNDNSGYDNYFVATTEKGHFYVSIVYYNGSYYYYRDKNGNTGKNSMADDKSSATTIERLESAVSNAEDLSTVKDKWIKIYK